MIDLRIALIGLAFSAGPRDFDNIAEDRLDGPVSLHFPDGTPMGRVVDEFRARSKVELEVVVAKDAAKAVESARVRIDVEGVPFKAALTMVVRQAGLIYVVEGSTVTIGLDAYREPDPKALEARMKKEDTTAYAPGYSEATFREIHPGMTEAQVHKVVGKPLREARSRPQVDWYYGPPTLRITPDGGMFDTSGDPLNAYGYTIARAHPDGKIFEVLGGYFDEVPKTMVGADLAAMKKRYGEPVATHTIKATRYLVYAGSKSEGSYRTRAVGVDSAGKVVDVISGYYFE